MASLWVGQLSLGCCSLILLLGFPGLRRWLLLAWVLTCLIVLWCFCFGGWYGIDSVWVIAGLSVDFAGLSADFAGLEVFSDVDWFAV